MKIGDLVRVTFGGWASEEATIGIFVRDDTVATGWDKDGFPVVTRAFVLWEGEVYSTPLDQIELINSS